MLNNLGLVWASFFLAGVKAIEAKKVLVVLMLQ